MEINWALVFASVASGLILTICTSLYVKMLKYIKKSNRERTMHSIKQDAMIYALCNVNHGFKDDFVPKYNEKYKELIAEFEFVHN